MDALTNAAVNGLRALVLVTIFALALPFIVLGVAFAISRHGVLKGVELYDDSWKWL